MQKETRSFENGFEKLAHYFDHDNNGIIEGAELSELKFWVDDGDAKTEEGELRELSEFGIQRINIPKKGELKSTTTALKEEFIPPKVKFQFDSQFPFNKRNHHLFGLILN